MRISDWSSDVCSSDLEAFEERHAARILAAFPCASLLRFGGEAVGIDHGHAMLALADTAPGIADLTKGQPALRGIAMLEQRAPQDQHIHTAISASGHRVARQAGGSGGTLPVGRAPRLDPWDTASFKLGDDLRSEEHTSELQSLMRI